MANATQCSSQQQRPPTLAELTASLRDIKDPTILDRSIREIIKALPELRQDDLGKTESSLIHDKDLWISSISKGDEFLQFVNEHTKPNTFSDSREGTKVVTNILQRIGQVHWIVGVFCIGAYLVQNFEKVSENKGDCYCLLSRMMDLASTVKTLKDVIPEEENTIENAVALIVEGSIMCTSQMKSKKLFRFLKASVNSEKLKKLSAKLSEEYEKINSAFLKRIATNQIMHPIKKPKYPEHAVGIKNQEEEVRQLLKLKPEHKPPLAVVIHGVGGIGKTTLAEAVLAEANLDGYHYARVYFEDKMSTKKIKKMQEIILYDAIPNHKRRNLRDCKEGKELLEQAFQSSEKEPVILFIDNVSESNDLAELLPDNLQCLPKNSRILLTTRILEVTDVLVGRGLERESYAVKTLPDQEAREILDKDICQGEDGHMKRILQICCGIPLVLRTMRTELAKVSYNAEDCQMLDNLEKGEHIRTENLSERLLDFVYNKFEPCRQDAFLDICWFFNKRYRRHVECIFGAQQVKSLEEAGLLTSAVVGNEEGLNAGEQMITVREILRSRGTRLSQSTRIKDYLSWEEAAEDKTILRKIKGIWLEGYSFRFLLQKRHLNVTAKSLRILSLGDTSYTTRQSRRGRPLPIQFNELRYLGIREHSLPIQFKADELRWYAGPIEGVSLYELPKKLRTIQAWSSARNLIISEEINPEQATQNVVLKELHLLEFTRMAQLQVWFNILSVLKILILDGWKVEELPEEVCRLSSLEKLCLRHFERLTRLPENFGHLSSLTHLDLTSCEALIDLPSGFPELRKLKHLTLSCCRSLTNSSSVIEQLPALECLNVSCCVYLSLDRKRLNNLNTRN